MERRDSPMWNSLRFGGRCRLRPAHVAGWRVSGESDAEGRPPELGALAGCVALSARFPVDFGACHGEFHTGEHPAAVSCQVGFAVGGTSARPRPSAASIQSSSAVVAG